MIIKLKNDYEINEIIKRKIILEEVFFKVRKNICFVKFFIKSFFLSLFF